MKQALREEIWQLLEETGVAPAAFGTIPVFSGHGRAAARLRRLRCYRLATWLMAAPDRALLQVRLNAIADGKKLVVATPGLRDGFYLLSSERIPPRHWPAAATSSGIRRHGVPLPTKKGAFAPIDLMLTGAVAVDHRGARLGKGTGYFDLEYTILEHLGCVSKATKVVALVDDLQVRPEIPMTAHDIPVDLIVTPNRAITTGAKRRPSILYWERLDPKIVRRLRPLRELRAKEI